MDETGQRAPHNIPTQTLWRTRSQVLICTGKVHSRYLKTWIVPGCNKNKSLSSQLLRMSRDIVSQERWETARPRGGCICRSSSALQRVVTTIITSKASSSWWANPWVALGGLSLLSLFSSTAWQLKTERFQQQGCSIPAPARQLQRAIKV